MSVDGGGTKVSAILYDYEFNLLGFGKSGAINQNCEEGLDAKKSMVECINQCFEGVSNIFIERIDITMPGDYLLFCSLVEQYFPVMEICNLSEGAMCILAGQLVHEGVIALAGTGSGAFCIKVESGNSYIYQNIGGYGSVLGDEGGGYDIGRKGMIAAIYSSDGRGGKSKLEQALLGLLMAHDMPNAIGNFYSRSSQKQFISAFAKVVVEAANGGDKIATVILKQAGIDMGMQINALFKKINEQSDVCISGSIWKNNPIMMESFSIYLRKIYPKIRVITSIYEPVMGGVIKQLLRADEGIAFTTVLKDFLQLKYPISN